MSTQAPVAVVSQQRAGTRVALKVVFPVDTSPPGRTTAQGRGLPAVFVQSAFVERDGAPVFSAHFGPFLARRPQLEFEIDGARPGSRLTLVWIDNAGLRFEQPIELAG
jgi:hypothetical protein